MSLRNVGFRAVEIGLLVATLSGCLWADVGYLAADSLGGRDNGTAGSLTAREYILDELRPIADGANQGATGDAAYLQSFVGGVNILAVIPGTDLADEYVVVGSHYDHLATCRVVVSSDTICNGATDNATGVAAVLEIARQVALQPTRRSLVVALWDGGEDELLGSRHYVANPLVPLADTVAYVNLDTVGANLRPILADVTSVIGAETGGPLLSGIVAGAAADSPLDETVLTAPLGMFNSDYMAFIEGHVPSVYFTDSAGACNHTTEDEFAVVDFAKLQAEIDTALRVARELADGPTRPTFVPTTAVVTYADVVALAPVSSAALWGSSPTEPDFPRLFDANSIIQLYADMGPEAFATSDLSMLIWGGLLPFVDALKMGPCDGFLD
jgi:Zn-dependent M28 family amino/carboxypeptidase